MPYKNVHVSLEACCHPCSESHSDSLYGNDRFQSTLVRLRKYILMHGMGWWPWMTMVETHLITFLIRTVNCHNLILADLTYILTSQLPFLRMWFSNRHWSINMCKIPCVMLEGPFFIRVLFAVSISCTTFLISLFRFQHKLEKFLGDLDKLRMIPLGTHLFNWILVDRRVCVQCRQQRGVNSWELATWLCSSEFMHVLKDLDSWS